MKPHSPLNQAPTLRFKPYYEAEAVLQAIHLPAFWRSLRVGIPNTCQTVLVIPGFMTGDWSTKALRYSLIRQGHTAFGWGLGKNRGDFNRDLSALTTCLERIPEPEISVVGWSLGGLYARELARRHPNRVAQVVTLGTAVQGGAKHTAAAAWYERRGISLERIAALSHRREQNPIPIPITAVYSVRDRFVRPEACVDVYNPHTQHIEVNCSHFGLTLSPQVHRLVLSRLAKVP